MSAPVAAIALSERGIPSFPCRSDKSPACLTGFKAATVDVPLINALWRNFPGELLGVPTGAASGIDVLDVDPRHGGEDWLHAHRDRLPATRQHATRSGGVHVLFRAAPGLRSSASRLATGVDVRAEGGYFIWWPAAGLPVLVEQTVAPWASWLLENLQPPPPPRTDLRVPVLGVFSEAMVEKIIRRALIRVETARPGERHVQLRAAACTIGGVLQSAGISDPDATRALFDAVKRAGGDAVDDRNALATIRWGLTKGARSPFFGGGHHA